MSRIRRLLRPPLRGRMIDWLLIIAALVAAIWLAALVYHNHFGGHVEREAPATQQPR